MFAPDGSVHDAVVLLDFFENQTNSLILQPRNVTLRDKESVNYDTWCYIPQCIYNLS